MSHEPLIVTLKLDPASFARLDSLRRAHFPAALNHIPAHLTLFHHLPGEHLAQIMDALQSKAPPIMALRATGLRKLGRGVALSVEGAERGAWRALLAHGWRDWLTPQDRQGFRPHVTIQNKVEPAAALALYDTLQATLAPFALSGEGVLVWRYLGGPWALESEVAFTSAS